MESVGVDKEGGVAVDVIRSAIVGVLREDTAFVVVKGVIFGGVGVVKSDEVIQLVKPNKIPNIIRCRLFLVIRLIPKLGIEVVLEILQLET